MKGMSMISSIRFPRLLVGCLVTGLGALTAGAVELYTSGTDEPEPRRPEVILSYGEPSLEGDSSEAQLREDFGLREGDTGGLERLYWENAGGSDWRIYLDAHALANPDEYGVDLEMNKGEKIYFDLNFRHWKAYDNGAGIWYPPTGDFPVFSAKALEKKINAIDISLQVQTSDLVRVELAYGFFNRKGKGLSTRFGDDYQYAIGGTPSRGIIPAVIDGEESVHTIDFRLVREDWLDRAGLRLHYQRRSVDRKHIVERAARQPSANRFTTQEEESSDDLFTASGFIRRELGDNLYGSIGFALTRLDGDLTGSRIFGAAPEAAYDLDFAALQYRDRGYIDLESDRRLKQWLFNANAVYTPSEDVRWMAGFRMEHLSTEVFSSYLDTWSTVDWQEAEFQREEAAMLSNSEKSALDLSGFVEGRYTGFDHVLLYSRVELAQQDGDLEEGWSREERVPDARGAVSLLDRATGFDRKTAFWEAGMHFYPRAGLKISLEGYLKYKENGFGVNGVTLPEDDFTLYPGHIGEQVFDTRDVNARLHWRLLNSLKSVTRVDYQDTTITSESDRNPSLDNAERRRLIFNQSLTWTPMPRLFVSGVFNYVEDLTETLAADLEGTFSGISSDLPNDYWQTELNIYYVLSKLIDIQVGYQYLEMANYIDSSPKTIPYGTDLEQHFGSVQFIFHISDRTRARLGYRVYDRDELSAAGNTDYTAHLINGSFQIIF